MVQTLEAIRGGGGSVRVGTVGTISSLMTRELQSSTSKSHTPLSSQYIQVPVSYGKGPLEPKKSDDQASSRAVRASTNKHRSPETMGRTSSQPMGNATPNEKSKSLALKENGNSTVSNGINRKNQDFSGKTRTHKCRSHAPMLSRKDTPLEKTPLREKPTRKGSNVVDIVDLNCGNPAGSLSNRLKKLGFPRMSQSFM